MSRSDNYTRENENVHAWPYAFEKWLKRVGIKNGQPLTEMDLYALVEYRKDWDEMGIASPIYYNAAREQVWAAMGNTRFQEGF